MRDGTLLLGKTCMITGASNGIGKAAAHELAKRGAELFLVCRDAERAQTTVEEIKQRSGNLNVEYLLADLSSQADIRRMAKEFLASGKPLHILLNNAGAIVQFRSETVDGIETTFALNHLAYFLLTDLLLDRLRENSPARIVNVSSDAHKRAYRGINFDDIEAKKGYGTLSAYGQSKLANILFTKELASQLEGSGVTVNCLHPGFVASRFGHNNGRFMQAVMSLIQAFGRTNEKGSESSVYLCGSPEVENTSGEYFVDCKVAQPTAQALDREVAKRLWQLSAEMTGLADPQPGS
jgi:NAD(P)-dependent dehydrogenase (short-subunit alcohol dehydrogenase family)